MQSTRDGYVTFLGYKTYYKIVGQQQDKNKLPLLVLNGGPGSPHNYLLDLQLLSKAGREVIFYDQLGSGMSDRPDDDALWTVETFIKEVEAVRKKLGLKNIHLLGHSWGGMLAIDYLLTKPVGIHSVVLASSMISMPLFQKEVNNLRRKLPLKTKMTLRKHEKAGTTDDPEYKQAYKVFSKKHIFRQDDWPTHLTEPPDSFGTTVYEKMWGQNECYPNGTLKTWDRIARLHEITVPTLITSGKYDELTPRQAEITQANIPNSERIAFEHSAHLAHIEEVSKYIKTVEKYLVKIEQKQI